jgi:hypothetical protein
VSFGHDVYDIVKGNRTAGLLFDARISGHPIELDRTDFEQEIKDASRYAGGDKKFPISGSQANSLLIGNTFLSEDAANSVKDQAGPACPKEGTYYSPDGLIIHFSCEGSPDPVWSVLVWHWKIKSGAFCRDGPSDQDGPTDIGPFGCRPATVMATFAPAESGPSKKIRVSDTDSGNTLIGYAGNVLNFGLPARS